MHPLQNIIYSRYFDWVFFHTYTFILFIPHCFSPHIRAEIFFSLLFFHFGTAKCNESNSLWTRWNSVHDLHIRSILYANFTLWTVMTNGYCCAVIKFNTRFYYMHWQLYTHCLMRASIETKHIRIQEIIFVCFFFFSLLTKSRHRPAKHSTMMAMASHVAWKT